MLCGLLVVLTLHSAIAGQEPVRVDPATQAVTKPVYREPRKGETVIEGLLQRVECPPSQPIRFTMRANDKVERFEAAQLSNVEFISHSPDVKGPMTCGGRGKGDRVRLTWASHNKARRVIAVEFLPNK